MVTSSHWSSASSVKFSHSRPKSQIICVRHAQSSPHLAYKSSLPPCPRQLVFRLRSVWSCPRRRLEDLFATLCLCFGAPSLSPPEWSFGPLIGSSLWSPACLCFLPRPPPFFFPWQEPQLVFVGVVSRPGHHMLKSRFLIDPVIPFGPVSLFASVIPPPCVPLYPLTLPLSDSVQCFAH